MKKLLVGTAFVLASGSLLAAAMPVHKIAPMGPHGWYAGVGINHIGTFNAKYDGYMVSNQAGVAYFHWKLETANIGFNLFAGYRLTQYLGTELGFDYIGSVKMKDRNNSANKLENKNSMLLAYNGNIYLPLGCGFEAYATGGVGYFSTQDKPKGSLQSSYPKEEFGGFALNYGGGLEYTYQQFGVRVNYKHIQPNHNADDVVYVPDVVGLDVLYHFG